MVRFGEGKITTIKEELVMNCKIILAVLLLWCSTATAVQAESISLSVAASMTDAFKEIIANFSADNPEGKILPNFASSGSLAKQIDQGAPADIYVSANLKWMRYLIDKKLIAPGTDRIFAYNKLVFVGKKENGPLSLTDLPALDRIALGSPQSVPAGQYARQAMQGAGIYSTLQRERKLVMAKDVRQALLYADRGEVDGAFAYRTDALLASNAEILFTVPDNLYDRVSYPMALTVAGARNRLAKSFYDYMATAKAVAILTRYGFEPAR